MNIETLRQIFKSPFDYTTYSREIVHRLFGCHDVASRPEWLDTNAEGDQSFFIGQMDDADHRLLGFFYTRVADGGDVRRKRVGLRKLISPYLKYDVDGAIAVFDDGRHWRLSYICDLKEGSTSAKRFSYILGDENGQYKTPLERLEKVARLNGRLTLSDLRESFSVDALSDEFFDEYHLHYDRIVANLTQSYRRDVTWRVSTDGTSDTRLHDYVKKMMGRIVFLHFLQKKGWLNGNPTFLRDLFCSSPHQADFLEQVLEPLFFGIFNTEPEQREKLFADEQWDEGLLKQWERLPYLNGGLFERDEVDEMDIRLPSSLFNDLFTFLASYNFTVDENDPDDAEIGVDPEMLGKIFESLLEDNKAKGAFYTPKEIVRYMCKESLIAYLSEQLSVNSEQNKNTKIPTDIDSQITDHSSLITKIRTFVETHEMQSELEPYRDMLNKALREVKICDPAIGSGAFPMGLLNELWRCREALTDHDSCSLITVHRSQLKKEIIENNIYGVDIERGAIDIARLRFWLSIVVDSDEPEALPNFDYKFMQGNSLIESFEGVDLSRMMSSDGQHSSLGKGRQKAGANQLGIEFVSTDTKRNLQLMLREYFSLTDHLKKAEARREINDSVKNYIRQQDLRPEAEARLSSLDPSANQEFFLWHTWFKDIFDKGGFDIVVANPPYVLVSSDDVLNLAFKRIFKTANEGKVNLYKLFYEHGLNMLKDKGILSYITPNTYLTNKDSGTLREIFFTRTKLIEIIEYTEKDKVFKNVTQAVTTIVLQKTASNDKTVKVRTFKHGSSICDQSELRKTGVILPINNVIRKMGRFLERLSDCFTIYQGEINLTAKRHLFSFEKRNDTLQMWRGNNVGKYCNSSNPIEWCDVSGSKQAFYNHERIVMQQVSNQNQPFRTKAFLSPSGYICGNSTNGLTPKKPNVNIRYYLGLINSKAFNYYFDYFSFTNHITAAELKSIPLPCAAFNQQNAIAAIVKEILSLKKQNVNADTSALEREIDRLVYGLYGLTEEEMKVVEGNV
ncbi:MAG: N-6 DNA methylase [Bacteroidales bacterium]|nr:N-6 DNA methylase [Bacteroidales bacterium]